jgi:hypothetical protein
LLTLCAAVLAIAPLGAQGSTSSDSAECLGFAFGRFVPALDLKAAGHNHLPSPDKLQHAPDSRDWAARDSTVAGMTLMLFPAWWPAGVQIVLPAPRSSADTLRGTAYALVADGRVTTPQAQVLAWRVPCGRPGRNTAPPPVVGGPTELHSAPPPPKIPSGSASPTNDRTRTPENDDRSAKPYRVEQTAWLASRVTPLAHRRTFRHDHARAGLRGVLE